MARTLVDIPDDPLETARQLIGPRATKAETVRTALEMMVRRARQKDAVKWFAEADPLADLRSSKVKRAAWS